MTETPSRPILSLKTPAAPDKPLPHKILTRDDENRIVDSGASLPSSVIRNIVWREGGPDKDPRARLRAIFQIGGTGLYVTAYAVVLETDEPDDETGDLKVYPYTEENLMGLSGTQRVEFADAEDMAETGAFWNLHGMEGAPETVEIEGRAYAIFACPYCR